LSLAWLYKKLSHILLKQRRICMCNKSIICGVLTKTNDYKVLKCIFSTKSNRNACTKSGPLRFSQFSGFWLILSVCYRNHNPIQSINRHDTYIYIYNSVAICLNVISHHITADLIFFLKISQFSISAIILNSIKVTLNAIYVFFISAVHLIGKYSLAIPCPVPVLSDMSITLP
jgi:hypothetical protein